MAIARDGEMGRYRILFLGLIIVQFICWGLLWFSCFPGALQDLMIAIRVVVSLFGWAIAIIALVIGTIFWLGRQQRSVIPSTEELARLAAQRRTRCYPTRMAIVTGWAVLLTFLLLLFNLPQRLVFSMSRSAFEAVATNPAQTDWACGHANELHLGLYRVLECDRDVKGGVYFKVYESGLRLYAIESYGFVYQPNKQWSDRFGSASQEYSYEYGNVVGDWYWFKAGKPYSPR